ncbi:MULTISPECIES: DUF3696 domain-containing protein [Pseudoalteromonas]|uniref:DUF3696 domain-containing protein n=1 Tax=Pseudoalteromonas amylolytica TaxID=1859457 RepID=A0A1S1MU63_9GAMM|nr:MULTISPECIES: DUF3696 domain-containing protein [Pseudoalteromonas]OHU86489.1 hypothetical protein BFC16_13295 [Pseudoalteromonas sp. JW3]OHU88986.1 hypothetical protein BET10_19465 [Pseudoalteromonas amylolytica]
MLNSIHIKSFKSVVDEKFLTKKLTVLTGLNSSGKSSIIQALRMAVRAGKGASPYIRGLGNFPELKSVFTPPGESILFHLTFDDGDFMLGFKKDTYFTNGEFLPNLEYIGANRLGPSSHLPIFKEKGTSYFTVGEQGEFCADFYKNFERVSVHERLRKQGKEGGSNLLRHQLQLWMEEISPNVEFDFTKEPKHDLSHIEINGYRAANTGFGLSYSLPIVLSSLVLSASDELGEITNNTVRTWFEKNKTHTPIFIIENPEAHIHPSGQTALGKLLAKAASSGIQVILETHSDHVIDGIRISAKNNDIDNTDIIINYCTKDEDGKTTVEAIEVNKKGKLSSWPVGFFDESIKNLRELT